jgi:hypothetical protein
MMAIRTSDMRDRIAAYAFPRGSVEVVRQRVAWMRGNAVGERSVSILRISPSCRTNTMLTAAIIFRGRSDG